MYSVQCKVYSVQCTVYSVHCTLHTLHCTLYTVHSTLYSLLCIVYSALLTVLQGSCDNYYLQTGFIGVFVRHSSGDWDNSRGTVSLLGGGGLAFIRAREAPKLGEPY